MRPPIRTTHVCMRDIRVILPIQSLSHAHAPAHTQQGPPLHTHARARAHARVQVKPVGVLAMIDDGELDWKVIAVSCDDPKAASVNDVADVERCAPTRAHTCARTHARILTGARVGAHTRTHARTHARTHRAARPRKWPAARSARSRLSGAAQSV